MRLPLPIPWLVRSYSQHPLATRQLLLPSHTGGRVHACAQKNHKQQKQSYSTHIPPEKPSTHHTDSRFKYFSYPGAPRPISAAFYTGNAPYHELLNDLRQQMPPDLIRKAEQLQLREDSDPEVTMHANKFISVETFKTKFGVTLSPTEHRTLVCHLATFEPNHQVLAPYFAQHTRTEQNAYTRTLDRFGRAFARGRRKTSLAHVHVVRSMSTTSTADGDPVEDSSNSSNMNPINDCAAAFFVNGIPLSDYFRRKPRFAAVFPLELAQAFGKYRVWAVVEGGGPTGQADAIAHGLAKALVVHEPALREKFAPLHLLDMDLRLVERKKYGQKKARKKFTWVKR